jgi:hypothetical protein
MTTVLTPWGIYLQSLKFEADEAMNVILRLKVKEHLPERRKFPRGIPSIVH